jgi:uncharacterized protein YjcR
MHGGSSTGAPKGNSNAATHGIYSKFLSEEEQQMLNRGDVRVGDLDHEIRLMRIRLRRALIAEKASKGKPELDEHIKRAGGSEYVSPDEKKYRVRDWVGIIDKTAARLQSLELARKELLDVDPPDADESKRGPIGRIVVEVVHAKHSHENDRAAG